MEDVCVTDAMTLVIMYLPRAYDDTKKLVFWGKDVSKAYIFFGK
jgi:hypothetical protein